MATDVPNVQGLSDWNESDPEDLGRAPGYPLLGGRDAPEDKMVDPDPDLCFPTHATDAYSQNPQ